MKCNIVTVSTLVKAPECNSKKNKKCWWYQAQPSSLNQDQQNHSNKVTSLLWVFALLWLQLFAWTIILSSLQRNIYHANYYAKFWRFAMCVLWKSFYQTCLFKPLGHRAANSITCVRHFPCSVETPASSALVYCSLMRKYSVFALH